MRYEIRKVDEEKGMVCITTVDERWYHDEINGKFYPSSTWICSHYPKSVNFYKWLADKGWNEAEALKNAAGNKGSKVHKAIETLLSGQEVKIDDKFSNREGVPEELTAEEYLAAMSFVDWYKEVKPQQILAIETSAINPVEGYGGTIDLVCMIDGQLWVIDFKTSSSVWKEYELQISSYRKLIPYALPDLKVDINNIKLAILQIGYARTKKGYKFTEIEDKFELFMHAKAIWQEECNNKQPLQKDFPLKLSLN